MKLPVIVRQIHALQRNIDALRLPEDPLSLLIFYRDDDLFQTTAVPLSFLNIDAAAKRAGVSFRFAFLSTAAAPVFRLLFSILYLGCFQLFLQLQRQIRMHKILFLSHKHNPFCYYRPQKSLKYYLFLHRGLTTEFFIQKAEKNVTFFHF